MARAIGVGGTFLACMDVEATRSWYSRVLGMDPDGGIAFRHDESAAAFGEGARTVFACFADASE